MEKVWNVEGMKYEMEVWNVEGMKCRRYEM